MRMIITETRAINIDQITSLEIEVEVDKYNSETGKFEPIEYPTGILWARTTDGQPHIIKRIPATTYTETQERLQQEMHKIIEQISSQKPIEIKDEE